MRRLSHFTFFLDSTVETGCKNERYCIEKLVTIEFPATRNGINMKWIFWYIELQKSIVIWKWIYYRTPEIAMHGAGIQVKLVGNNLKLEHICKHLSNKYHHNILLTKSIEWCSVCSVGYICHKVSFMKLETIENNDKNWKGSER